MMGGPGMGGPGGPGMGGPGGPGMGGPGGPGMGGPGGPGMHGPDPGMVFEMIKKMYPDPDTMPAGLGDTFKKAETAHKAAEASHKEAMKAGITFLKGFIDYAKKETEKLGDDPKAGQYKHLSMQAEQAIKMMEMQMQMMEHPPMGPPMGGQGTQPSGGNK